MKPIRDEAHSRQVRVLARDLLESAGSDAPSPEAMRRTAAALGISAAALGRAVEAAAGAGLAAANTATGTAGLGVLSAATGVSAKLLVLAPLVPWFAAGLVATSLVAGGIYSSGRWDSGEALDENAAEPFSASRSSGQALKQRGAGASHEVLRPTERSLPAGSLDFSASEQNALPVGARQPAAKEGRARESSPKAVPSAEARARVLDSVRPPTLAYPAETDHSLPPAPRASTRRLHKTAPPDQLTREVTLLDRARSHLASGRLQAARAALDRYRAECKDGVLRAEALALSADMWLRAGNEPEARRSVEQLERAFPQSQHLERFPALRSRGR